MANDLRGIFQTLVVPAANELMTEARFQNILLDSVFTQFDGDGGGIGQTLNINVPIVNESNVNSIGSGPIVVTDTAHTPFQVVIDTKYSDAERIQSFDQIRTPLQFKTLYLGAMVESVLRKANRRVAAEFNPASSTGILSVNTVVTGAVANSHARADLSSAWTKLVNQGCPMGPRDLQFVTNPTPWGNMAADTTSAQWVTQYVVGTAAAELAQQQAKFMPQFSMRLDYDQTMPQNGSSKYIACAFHRWAIGMKFIAEDTPVTGGYVEQMYIFPRKNVPVRIQMWYDPNQQGVVLHVSTAFGIKTVRPEFAVQVLAG